MGEVRGLASALLKRIGLPSSALSNYVSNVLERR